MSKKGEPSQYDAFLSYSHARDRTFARHLQRSLESFTAPFFSRRGLRLFRDDASLPMTSDLWPKIHDSLERSSFLLLLASPESAASDWVTREVLAFLDANPVSKFGIVITHGTVSWIDGTDPVSNREAVSTVVRDRLGDAEPLCVDVRPYREQNRLARTREADSAVAAIAAGVTGRDKDEIFGEHIRLQRRRLTGLFGLVALLLVASVAAVAFGLAAQRAADQARSALSRSDYNTARAMGGGEKSHEALAYLARALRTDPDHDLPAIWLRRALVRDTWPLHRYDIPRTNSDRFGVAFSSAGNRFALIQTGPPRPSDDVDVIRKITVYDARTGRALWKPTVPPPPDHFAYVRSRFMSWGPQLERLILGYHGAPEPTASALTDLQVWSLTTQTRVDRRELDGEIKGQSVEHDRMVVDVGGALELLSLSDLSRDPITVDIPVKRYWDWRFHGIRGDGSLLVFSRAVRSGVEVGLLDVEKNEWEAVTVSGSDDIRVSSGTQFIGRGTQRGFVTGDIREPDTRIEFELEDFLSTAKFSPDGNTIASITEGGRINLVVVGEKQLDDELRLFGAVRTNLWFCENSDRGDFWVVYGVRGDRHTRLVAIDRDEMRGRTVPLPLTGRVLDVDPRCRYALEIEKNRIRVWDIGGDTAFTLNAPKELTAYKPDKPHESRDGRWIAEADKGDNILIRDAQTGSTTARIQPLLVRDQFHGLTLERFEFDPTGRFMSVTTFSGGGGAEYVSIYSAADGARLFGQMFGARSFSEDGRYVFSQRESIGLFACPGQAADLASLAEAVANRRLDSQGVLRPLDRSPAHVLRSVRSQEICGLRMPE